MYVDACVCGGRPDAFAKSVQLAAIQVTPQIPEPAPSGAAVQSPPVGSSLGKSGPGNRHVGGKTNVFPDLLDGLLGPKTLAVKAVQSAKNPDAAANCGVKLKGKDNPPKDLDGRKKEEEPRLSILTPQQLSPVVLKPVLPLRFGLPACDTEKIAAGDAPANGAPEEHPGGAEVAVSSLGIAGKAALASGAAASPDVAFALRLTEAGVKTDAARREPQDPQAPELSSGEKPVALNVEMPAGPETGNAARFEPVQSPSVESLPERDPSAGQVTAPKVAEPASRPLDAATARPRSVNAAARGPQVAGERSTAHANVPSVTKTAQNSGQAPDQQNSEPAFKDFLAKRNMQARDQGASLPEVRHAAFDSQSGDRETATLQVDRSATEKPQANGVQPEASLNPGARPQPIKQISLKLGADAGKVDVQLTERAGRVQVAVRTPDHELAKSLQTDLGELVGRLENRGFKTETWVPAAGGRHVAAAWAEQSNSAGNQDHTSHGGSSAWQQQERQGQNGSNARQQPRWTAQMEETLNTDQPETEEK